MFVVRQGMDVQLPVGQGKTAFPEEDIGHILAEMLAGMDDPGMDRRVRGQGIMQKGKLDKLRPVADYVHNIHGFRRQKYREG